MKWIYYYFILIVSAYMIVAKDDTILGCYMVLIGIFGLITKEHKG